jgi:cytoskeletal protein RodZ
LILQWQGGCSTRKEPQLAIGGFVKKRIQSLSFLATLAIAVGMISWGSTLHAQQTPSTPQDPQTQQTPQSTPPDTTPQQTPDTPPSAQQPSQTPDNGSKSANPSSTDSQMFSGTVEKQGSKYVLKDDSGKTYDIDHQTDVAKFEGKRVRVQGTLDPSGTKILVK